jgi:serine/threonine-protein kinase
MIVFGINTNQTNGIQALPESGGTIRTLVTVDPNKERLTQPQLFADGKHVLFVSTPLASGTGAEGQIVVQTINGKDRRTLVNGGIDPRVLPSGQLVYLHEGTLLGVPFDAKRLAVTGGPVSLVEGITENADTSAGQFAVSSDGTLAFLPGASARAQRTLTWVDREGHEQALAAKSRAYAYPRLSPDGTRIAVDSADEENDIWVFDLAKDTLTRLTFGPAYESHPIWTPDNKYLIFSAGPSPPSPEYRADIVRKAADGTGTVEMLTQHLEGGFPLSLTPDGKSLVFRKSGGLAVLQLDPKGDARPLIADPKFNEYNAEISPDGRWLAYDSNESGRREIYVRPFPAVDSGRWQISSEGGTRPLWSRTGRELFFLNASNRMVAVPVPAGPGFIYGKPQVLFDANSYFLQPNSRPFDISTDGKRFLMLKEGATGDRAARPSIVVVSHWFDEVKARMAAQR